MRKNPLFPALCLLLATAFVLPAQSQQKQQITLEDIWASGRLFPSSVYGVNWMLDGKYYSSQTQDEEQGQQVVKYDVTTGQIVNNLFGSSNLVASKGEKPISFDEYSFSSDEKRVMLSTESEPVYRYSSLAENYIYDLQSKKLTRLSKAGKQKYATFSPAGNQVAFVRDNNLFVTDVSSGDERAITSTGKVNELIHGGSDWVYEEELELVRAFEWSPNGGKIAYLSFNEANVPEYNMQVWNDLYPTDYRFKYPKAGEKNSIVGLSIYDLKSGKTLTVDVDKEEDQYIPRIGWTPDGQLYYMRLNRLQNKLDLFYVNAETGSKTKVLTETTNTYLELDQEVITFTPDGEHFIFSSERDGYKHIYLYQKNGEPVRQLTQGNWEVDEVLGVSDKGIIYYTAAEMSPMERQLYSINLKGKKKKLLTPEAGTHTIDMSQDFTFFIDYYSTLNSPPVVSLHRASDGRKVKVLEDNQRLKDEIAKIDITPATFFKAKNSEGTELNGWMIKPANFDKNKKYPVLMHVYGGPGSQTVLDSWRGPNYFWHQMLAQQGYIVVSIDNRGTGARGANFQKGTYAQLGKLETQDQIDMGKYMASLPYVDAGRIGIWGWSYGGYMSSLAILKGNDVFKAAIAVAPVTTWRFYDTIYTERYLKTPQENPEGYDDNSPTKFADQLKGNYLLVHGTGDDNVHFQNAVTMQNALIANNKQFESFYYPNRNHGIYGGYTRLHLYTLMTDFLKRKL